MQKDKVVYICVTGNYDDIISHSFKNDDWDYVCFTDNDEILKKGHVFWKVRPLVFGNFDDVRNNRWHKLHPHILFPEYSESLYVDANVDILDKSIFEDIKKVGRLNSLMSLGPHFIRKNVYDEFDACELLGKDDVDIIKKQKELLKKEGFSGEAGVFFENNIIYRKHNDGTVIKIMEDWWWWIENYSRRDQLSLSYVLWKNNFNVVPLSETTYRNSPGIKFMKNENHITKEELMVEKKNFQEKIIQQEKIIEHKNEEIDLMKFEIQLKNEEIDLMKSSKFWKLRELEYKIKFLLFHPGLFAKKYNKKLRNLYLQASFSLQKEGFLKVLLRTFNFILYGKGVLNKSEIRKNSAEFELEKYDTENILKLDIEKVDKIDFKKEEKPEVSIIIPVFNKWQYTYNCLDSLKKNIEQVAYEVIVVDDGSSDETAKMISKVENVTYVKNEKNLGFVGSCNSGAKSAKGDYLVFLNNDTAIKKNWLESLLETFEKNENIGLVGSKLIYPDGRLQEAGGIIWKNQNAWNYGRYKNPKEPEFNYFKDVDYCSGASIVLPKKIFEKLGGFDEIFSPGYFEDADLAFRVRQLGFRTVYQPKSELFHFEGITSGTDLKSGMKKYQEVNKKTFFERWGSVLEKENFDDISDGPFLARDRSKNKKTILVIDHYVPTFDKDAGSRTVYQYVKLLCSLQYNVKFIGDNFLNDETYTVALQQLGVEVLYGQYLKDNWENWLKNNSKHIDFVFLNRPHIAVKYIDSIRRYTDAKVVYYGHDLHFLRIKREYDLTRKENLLRESEIWKKTEFDVMKEADMSLYPSQVEIDEIKKNDVNIVAQTLNAYMFEDNSFEYDAKSRKNLLFIGGFIHKPNVDAVLWFCNEIFPKVLIKNPDIKFYIVGSNPVKEIFDLKSDNIIVKGFMEDNELEKLYREIRLTVAPLRYGAGIKGKIIESMNNCVPVLTTSCGAEGLIDENEIFILADTVDEFADKLTSDYLDYDKLNSISVNGKHFVDEKYSIGSAINQIKKIF